jgi:hypothetical protein
MPEQKIVITIDDNGGITAKTNGFKGDSCLSALDELLDFDGVISNIKKTDEYHQTHSIGLNRVQEIKRS